MYIYIVYTAVYIYIYIYIYILESSGALRAPLILLYSETLGRLQCGLDFCQLNEANNSRVYTYAIYTTNQTITQKQTTTYLKSSKTCPKSNPKRFLWTTWLPKGYAERFAIPKWSNLSNKLSKNMASKLSIALYQKQLSNWFAAQNSNQK